MELKNHRIWSFRELWRPVNLKEFYFFISMFFLCYSNELKLLFLSFLLEIFLKIKYVDKFDEQSELRKIKLVVMDLKITFTIKHFPGGSEVKASASNAGDLGSIPGLGRSPGEGNGNPLQYCCLENPMNWGAWWAAVHGVTKSQTRLSDFTYLLTIKHSLFVITVIITHDEQVGLKVSDSDLEKTSVFNFLLLTKLN